MNTVPDSPQTFLDLLVRESAAGRLPSMRDEDTCAYRGLNGFKCAVGHLIPDDRYDPAMEECGKVTGVIRRGLWEPPAWADRHDLLQVQDVHDALAAEWNHAKWVEKLLACRLFAGLTPSSQEGNQ